MTDHETSAVIWSDLSVGKNQIVSLLSVGVVTLDLAFSLATLVLMMT